MPGARLHNPRRGIAAVLLALGVTGCSRAPIAPKPEAVFVDAAALARYHPQWADVADMDRQIAWLSTYQPGAATPVAVTPVNAALPRSEQVAVDTSALRARIATTLDAVRAREREALERRLERARRRERAAGVSAERAALEDEADRRFQDVLDRVGAEMANLDVQMSVTASLQRSYAARGPQWEALAKQMEERRAALKNDLDAARARRTAAVEEVFAWLEEQFRLKDAAEDEAARAYRMAHQEELDTLDASIERQKQLLLASLPTGVHTTTLTGSGAPLAPVTLSGALPPLSGPKLAARIAALRARREKLAAFILQNTEAVVKSAAPKQTPPVQPVFAPNRRLPDSTDVFRPAVQNPAPTLERLS